MIRQLLRSLFISLFVLSLLVLKTVLLVSPVRAAILYNNTFESDIVGSIPSGWVNIGTATWQVGTTNPTSGTKSFIDPTFHVGGIAVYTGAGTATDSTAQISQIVQLDVGGAGVNSALFLRLSNDGNNGYLIAPNFRTSELILFKKLGGTYTVLASNSSEEVFSNGDIVILKAEINGTLLRGKMWKSTDLEPPFWQIVATDSSVVSGYLGVYQGWNKFQSVGTTSSLDDINWKTEVEESNLIEVDNSDWALGRSPYNWKVEGSSYMQAVNPGAYFKAKFSGTSVRLETDVSALSGLGVSAKKYPRIRYRIDGGSWQTYQLLSTTTTVPLAYFLADSTHDLELIYLSSDAYTARWNGTMGLKISGLVLDPGKSLSAFTVLNKRILAFGDSITEGAWVLGDHTDLTNYSNYSESTASYLVGIASNLEAEYGNLAFGGLSWASTFNSDVPPLPNSWNYFYSTHSRFIDNLFSPLPHIILVNVGTNGGLSTSSILTNWLSEVRVAAGSYAKIFVIVPFNGTGRTNITAGYNSYISDSGDDKTFLIDLGSDGSTYSTSTPTYSFDGLHPNIDGQSELATLVYQAMLPNIDTVVPNTTDSGTDSQWHNNGVTVTLNCTDLDSGCAHTYYTTDGTSPTTISSQGTTINLTDNGTYTIKYFSVDNDGNQESIKNAANTVKIGQDPTNSSVLPSPPTCDATTPSKAPWLYGASAKSSSSILLQFSEAGDPVSEYVLEYGTETGKYPFAMANIGGKGTTSYLVQSLNSNTRYYFRVRASNGCATGSWSNELSATTTGKLSLFNNDLEISTLEAEERKTSNQKQCKTYTVTSGDTLTRVSQDQLGDSTKFSQLIEQNKDKYPSLETNPSALEVGWVLIISCDGKDKEISQRDDSEIDVNDPRKTVLIKVVDEDKKAVKGAKVTLHSTPRETESDENGVALFDKVEVGEHRVVIAYQSQTGEQKIYVKEDSESEEIDFTIQIKTTNPFLNPWVLGVVTLLATALVISLAVILRSRKSA